MKFTMVVYDSMTDYNADTYAFVRLDNLTLEEVKQLQETFLLRDKVVTVRNAELEFSEDD